MAACDRWDGNGSHVSCKQASQLLLANLFQVTFILPYTDSLAPTGADEFLILWGAPYNTLQRSHKSTLLIYLKGKSDCKSQVSGFTDV